MLHIVSLTNAAKLLKPVNSEYMLLHATGILSLDTSDQLLHKLALLLCKLHCKLHMLVNEMFYTTPTPNLDVFVAIPELLAVVFRHLELGQVYCIPQQTSNATKPSTELTPFL